MHLPSNYPNLLHELKQKIQRAQTQTKSGWGSKVIQQLAKDLKKAFPDQKDFSKCNLKYMRHFAEKHPERQFVQEVLAQTPWYHNITIMEKVKDLETRTWPRLILSAPCPQPSLIWLNNCLTVHIVLIF